MKNKILKTIMLIAYTVVHSILAINTMTNVACLVFSVWLLALEHTYILLCTIIAVIVMAIDSIVYAKALKAQLLPTPLRKFMFVTDFFIASFSTSIFMISNGYIVLAKGFVWNLPDLIFFSFGLVLYGVILAVFIFIRLKLFRIKNTEVKKQN